MEPRIVIFGGTTEGRMLAECLAGTSAKVFVCVATEYGGTLVESSENIQVIDGRMDEDAMADFFEQNSINYCLDATHPYAALVTENIRAACEEKKIPYIRVMRREQDAQGHVIYCGSVEEAAEYLKNTSGKILVTTGSKELEKYTVIPEYLKRCIVRVLPTVEVLKKCEMLGFAGRNVIGMQGPFDYEMNIALLKQTGAKYLVTKNSGKEGGFAGKCEAARDAGVTLVVIGRPSGDPEGVSLGDAIQKVVHDWNLSPRRKFSLIGMGPGDWNLLTGEAMQKLEEADVIIGAKRVVDICPENLKQPRFYSYKQEEILEYLQQHMEYVNIALVYSGDVGLYSGAGNMARTLKKLGYHPDMVSGISSISYFLSRIGISYEDVTVCSCHGKEENLLEKIRSNARVVTLVGEEDFLMKTAEKLIRFGMNPVKITVGERLSYPDMRILEYSTEEAVHQTIDKLAVVLFENPVPAKMPQAYIADEAFVRGAVPMTKEEIRILSLEKMELKEDSVCYDIGAGTGSVSVQMARKCPLGQVYAIEKNSEGIELIETNRLRHQVDNLQVVEGVAPEILAHLPAPTHVFIGGSDKKMREIIDAVRSKNPSARFVINAITLETISTVMGILREYSEYKDAQILSVQISRNKNVGDYHLMEAQNPIYIISFGG